MRFCVGIRHLERYQVNGNFICPTNGCSKSYKRESGLAYHAAKACCEPNDPELVESMHKQWQLMDAAKLGKLDLPVRSVNPFRLWILCTLLKGPLPLGTTDSQPYNLPASFFSSPSLPFSLSLFIRLSSVTREFLFSTC